MVLGGINGGAWVYQTAHHGSLHGPPVWIVLVYMPYTESTALLLESKWVL